MKDIPVQLHSFRKTTMGDNLIVFRVDEMYTDTLTDLMQKKIGTEFKMDLVDVTTGVVLGGGAPNNDTRQKFFRQLHAKMRELSERGNFSEEEVKRDLIQLLRERGIEIESTTELDIKGLAIAIGIMEGLLND